MQTSSPSAPVLAAALLLGTLAAAVVKANLDLHRPRSEAVVRERVGQGVVAVAAPVPQRVDPNRAPAHQLQTLPGIGPKLSERIVEYRQAHGKFETAEDLLRVRGIGPALLARWQGRLLIGADLRDVGGRPKPHR